MNYRYFIFSAVLFSCLTTACQQTPQDTNASPYWIEQLESPQKRKQALKQLGKIADKTSHQAITKWLQTPGAWQPDAAYALGQLKDPTLAPTLINAMNFTVGAGRDKQTRLLNRININIAKALSTLKNPIAVQPLMRLAKNPDLATQEATIRALGHMQDPQATAMLANTALHNKHPFLRKTAIQALGHLKDPKAVPALIQTLFMEMPGTSFYYEARFSLLQIGRPAIPALIDTLNLKNTEVQSIRMSDGRPIAPGAIEGKTAFVLGMLQAHDSVPSLIKAFKKYNKMYAQRDKVPVYASIPATLMEIAYALGHLRSPQAVPVLLKMANNRDVNMRNAANEALISLGAQWAAPSLLKFAKKGSVAERLTSLDAIAMLGDANILKKAIKMVQSASTRKPELNTSLKALQQNLEATQLCGKKSTCWIEKLQHPSVDVRRRATHQLGWLNTKKSVPALMQTLGDTNDRVRMAAIGALRQFKDLPIDALQQLYQQWHTKISYKDSSRALKRLIVQIKNS